MAALAALPLTVASAGQVGEAGRTVGEPAAPRADAKTGAHGARRTPSRSAPGSPPPPAAARRSPRRTASRPRPVC
ncbi:hypothetical protein ACFQ3Z_23160 [Streptomyces nogalater]